MNLKKMRRICKSINSGAQYFVQINEWVGYQTRDKNGSEFYCYQISKPDNQYLLVFNERRYEDLIKIMPEFAKFPKPTNGDFDRWLDLGLLNET